MKKKNLIKNGPSVPGGAAGPKNGKKKANGGGTGFEQNERGRGKRGRVDNRKTPGPSVGTVRATRSSYEAKGRGQTRPKEGVSGGGNTKANQVERKKKRGFRTHKRPWEWKNV